MSIEMSPSSIAVANINNTAAENKKLEKTQPLTPASATEKTTVEPGVVTSTASEAEEPSRESGLEPELQKEQMEQVAQKLQDFIGSLNKGLEFSVDEDSGKDVIKVIDRSSGDVLRQYPSEEVLDLVATLSDMTGNFVNIKA